MADTIRDTFFENKAAGALWDVAVSIKRGNPLPLDSNSVFESYEALKTYAGGVLAYPGQIVAVVAADSTNIYYLDQELNINEVGKIPSGDDKSVEVNNEKISIHDFGKAFYKYVAEVTNNEGEITSEAHYEKVEVSSDNAWKAGLEPKVVSEDGQLVVGWFEPNPTTIEGVNNQVSAIQGDVEDLSSKIGTSAAEGAEATGLYKEIADVETEVVDVKQEVATIQEALNGTEEVDGLIQRVTDVEADLANKINADSVYTKTETENLINSAGHLKREIVTQLPAVEDGNEDTIYMIKDASIGTDEDAYAEFMLIDGVFEKIGDTKVDLSEYAKSADVTQEITEAVKDFATDEEVGAAILAGLADYAKSADVTQEIADTIAPLAKSQEVEDALKLKADASALDGLATKQELEDGLADKVTASALAEELAIYATSQQLTDGLAAKVDQSVYDEHLTAMNSALAAKLDLATWEAALPGLATDSEVAALIGQAPTKNDETGDYEGATGIYTNIYTKDEVTKLVADITGGESAADVLAALNAYKTSTNPRIDELETLAKIKSVSDEFTLIDGTLTVNTIEAGKITGLAEAVGIATEEDAGIVKSATGDNKVNVAADGTMSVEAVNVNSLTQTEGQELILNGGGASF